MTRRIAAVALQLVALTALSALSACSSGSEPSADRSPSGSPTPSASSPAAAPGRPTPPPRPADRACYRLSFDVALAPTNGSAPADCAKPHTSMTFKVGTLDTLVDGHLLAVDSKHVQAQVATDCPAALPQFLGGTPEALHLSMFRAVWFTPTVEQSDAGANWFRCDVIAIAGNGKLAPLTGKLAGVLGDPQRADGYGMCGTAEPGTAGFNRVICSGNHSWRALRTVPFGGSKYPGEASVRDGGQQTCKDAGRDASSDKLSFKWGYEWPTEKQWAAGQHYGLCWAPD